MAVKNIFQEVQYN